MSKADEMFEKLGYKKLRQEDCWLEYRRQRHDNRIKYIKFETNVKIIFVEDEVGIGLPIQMQELQAINEKVKELGWNE